MNRKMRETSASLKFGQNCPIKSEIEKYRIFREKQLTPGGVSDNINECVKARTTSRVSTLTLQQAGS